MLQKCLIFLMLGFSLSNQSNPLVCRIDYYHSLGELDPSDIETECSTSRPYINTLLLHGSSIRTIHKDALHGLYRLRKLNLEDNNLTELDQNLFISLKFLIDLNLMRNQLSYLPPSLFHGMTKLERLNLAYNKLTYIDTEWFESLLNLKYLSLMFNLINMVDARFVASFNRLSLSQLEFDNNLCSIKFTYFWKTIHNCKLKIDTTITRTTAVQTTLEAPVTAANPKTTSPIENASTTSIYREIFSLTTDVSSNRSSVSKVSEVNYFSLFFFKISNQFFSYFLTKDH